MAINKKLFIKSGAGAITPSEHFGITLFNGNNTTVSTPFNASTEGGLFWISNRQHANGNFLIDSVRGVTETFFGTDPSASVVRQSITAFNSASVTVGTYSSIGSGGSGTNVLWSWRGGGAASSNSDGSITSSVSANVAAGFSITAYTGNGTQNATVGNGFNTQASLVIIKNRDQGDAWFVGSPELGTNQFMELNLATAKTTNSDLNYTINSTTMQFTSATPHHMFNASGERYLMYSFANITGYQKIGTYTGTGSGLNQINVGFAPRVVIFKCHDTASTGWRIFDTTRGTDKSITLNSGGAEYDDIQNYVDFTSTGFEFNNSGVSQTNGDLNGSGRNYIYLAIA